jgi:mono/diheme cytochrome c family protein
MKFRPPVVVLAAVVAGLLCGVAEAAPDPALIQKGEYLARAGDCIACHTAPGGKPFAGGLIMQTPVGSLSTPNLTPDKETGLGNWSDADFYRALHEGIGKNGEYLYPAFPFPWYTSVTEDDARAIKAYLDSLAPEHAPRKPLHMAFPFNVRDGLLAWRTAFFKPKTFAPDPKKSDVVNRGAYLVEGLGHCGECHNRDNLLGASQWSGRLEGGEIEGWYAPNITSDGRQGVGQWSEDEIATYLKTGSAAGRGVALGPMLETIHDSLSHLTDADLHAMAAYLKSVPAVETFKPTVPQQAPPSGVQVYLTNCAACHRPDGKGVPGAIPNLAGNGAVMAQGPENVIRAVLGGLPAGNGLAPMPAIGQGMSDDEVAAVVNYVRTNWGNGAPANAQAGLVGTLRQTTQTVMALNEPGGCPKVGDPKLIALLSTAGVPQQMQGINSSNMLQRIDTFVPKLAADMGTAKSDDVVNAAVATYCPLLAQDTSMTPAQRATLLGDFGGLVYGRLKDPMSKP